MILCIDPGNEKSGWATVAPGPALIDCGKDANADVRERVCEGAFEALILEGIQSYGKPVGRSIFGTAQWLGRYWECAAARELPVVCVFRPEVFRAVTGCMRGGDRILRHVLSLRFGKETARKLGGKGSDTWSAFALGVYYWDRIRLGRGPIQKEG